MLKLAYLWSFRVGGGALGGVAQDVHEICLEFWKWFKAVLSLINIINAAQIITLDLQTDIIPHC